ncbi:MAG: glutamate 5-kinase [Verrucomicrobiae bacterium]|nr:glutamate 5-kinase [Verrucomicrobiae bacterium]
MKLRQQALARVRRLVVKVGTGVLTDVGAKPMVGQLVALHRDGMEILVVSSGAIAAGMKVLGLTERPRRLDQLQACAAVGQGKLMGSYDALFGEHGIHVAQVLLTHDDLRNRHRHLCARSTLLRLLAHRVIPIINENDTVAVDEIKFGDNDRLSALVATLVDADLLVILSHIEGLLDADKNRISIVPAITAEVEALAGGTDRATSVGGMKSKIEAAKIVTRAGIPMIIASGVRDDTLLAALAGEDVGTLFLPKSVRLQSRKRWIAFFQKPCAKLIVDAGAKRALCEGRKSLLAKGLVRTEGSFMPGHVVSIAGPDGVEFARGLARDGEVVVHRDDLVIL